MEHRGKSTVVLALLGMMLGSHCRATSWCFVQRIGTSPRGLELQFDADRNMFVRITADDGHIAPSDPMFEIHDGAAYRSLDGGTRLARRASRVFIGKAQQAFVSGDYHATCIVRPALRKGVQGAWMESTVNFPGFAPQKSRRFVPVPDQHDTQKKTPRQARGFHYRVTLESSNQAVASSTPEA